MNAQQYQQFKQHPFIQSITNIPRWTISNEKKIPLDMRILITENRIHGANFYDEQSLTTLTEIDDFFAKANQLVTNHAFFLDVMIDQFVVLDIEPDCPEDIKEKLLNTPYIYGEVSLSGKGYHLVFPTPKCFMDYPNAHAKPALKENKYYEILLNHFCTFTGRMIQPPANPTVDFNDIYKSLAENAKMIAKQREVDITTLTEKPDTKMADKVLELLKFAGCQWNKRPSNFKKDKCPSENDPSRYEWAYIAYLKKKLSSILCVSMISEEGHEYTEQEQAYFLYTVIQELIPHREKHDTYRLTSDGTKLPWLGYLIKDVMEKVTDDRKEGES